MKINDREVNVEKIVIKYEDGAEKEIGKGIVITDSIIEDGDHKLVFEFANIKGTELATIIFGVTEMGVKMGLFDKA